MYVLLNHEGDDRFDGTGVHLNTCSTPEMNLFVNTE
jgi:hypothetical protein